MGTLVTQKEFWQALVAKAWQRFDYGAGFCRSNGC